MYRFILPAFLLLGGASALSADTKGYEARQAAQDKVDLDKQLSGLVAGKPQGCIDPIRYRESTRVGDTILYKNGRSDIMRTDTGGGCFGLRRGDAIVTRTFGSQLCRGDIVRTVDLTSSIPSGSCSFGDFVPYRKP
ncbi:hypothetical protein [Sphingomonas psychrolutea]|uniref:Uncharacterized protein n=1 Tax=Sphingomonas psychrolutea TaxID=1259676 RepID=A0ABQ1H897_9SPHN|nr:hypothetical protein [Sphingomonas psychrolutea]GGA60943.1 hypothetical protein GCM10011395_34120 [Sphingomonas psychrolutea]